MDIRFQERGDPTQSDVVALYRANRWSSGEQPARLMRALAGSDHVVCAYRGSTLVGLANAISDGALVVYFPHVLVHPAMQRRGIGRVMMRRMMSRYVDFHQQVLLADAGTAAFYEGLGFRRSEKTSPMWIYAGEG